MGGLIASQTGFTPRDSSRGQIEICTGSDPEFGSVSRAAGGGAAPWDGRLCLRPGDGTPFKKWRDCRRKGRVQWDSTRRPTRMRPARVNPWSRDVTIPDTPWGAFEKMSAGTPTGELTCIRRLSAGPAFCTKHISRVARGALENYRYPPAVRFKEGGHLGRCLSYLGGSARGRPRVVVPCTHLQRNGARMREPFNGRDSGTVRYGA